MSFSLNRYLKAVTDNFDDFKTEGEHFARASNVLEAEEVLQNITKLNGFVIMAIDMRDGNFGDRGHDSYRDEPLHRFYVLKRLKILDGDDREMALDACKAIGKKIFKKMDLDKRTAKNGLTFLDISRINYMTIGPLADNFHGIMFSFASLEKLWVNVSIDEHEDFEL